VLLVVVVVAVVVVVVVLWVGVLLMVAGAILEGLHF